MAKEIVAFAWCDVCMRDNDGQKEPGITTPPIAFGTAVPKELDLCDVHTKEYIEPLRLLLAELGQSVKPVRPGRPSKTTPVVSGGAVAVPGTRTVYAHCLVCGFGSKSKAAYGQHLKTKHDTLMSDPRVVEQLYGGDNPIEPRLEYACDQCPISYDRKSSLSGHKTLAHGDDA